MRQYQVHALARGRGWADRLQDGFDGEGDPTALASPEWGLAAQFFVEGTTTSAAIRRR